MGAVSYLTDTLRNLASGLGTVRDKTTQSSFYFQPMDPGQLEAMYRSDWMARKAVDIPAFDSVRAWRNWQADKDQIETIEKEEKRLGIKGKLLDAMILARLYGGAALVMGVRDDEPNEPLKSESVRQGDLRYVHVMDRFELTASELRRDPEDEWFGEPRAYQMNTDAGRSLQVHPSRVVRLTGARQASRTRSAEVWGDSMLQAVADAVKNAAMSSQSIAALLNEAKTDIYKVPGLMDILATKEGTERLTARFDTANTIKSIINGIVLDAEEDWQQKQISFAQLPEILQMYLLIVSGAADIPATRMLGQSPAGMNATGESDLKNYYDRIGAEQELTLSPRLERLDEVMIRSAIGSRDEAIWYQWNPLWKTDQKERSEIEKARAETVAKLGASGLVPSVVLAKALENALIESGEWPGIDTAYRDFATATGEFDPEAGDPNSPVDDPETPGPTAPPEESETADGSGRMRDARGRFVSKSSA